MVSTFLLSTKHAKGLILAEAFDFQINLDEAKGLKIDKAERALKKELTKKNPKGVNDQTLTSGKEGEKYTG